MRFLAMISFLGLLGFLSGCGGTGSSTAPGTDAPPPESPANPAPWQGATLARAEVPAVYVEEWQQADNRATCALIAPAALGEGEGATVRAANFAGGWGIAYDQPGLRSAFGIAGTGVAASEPSFDDWPVKKEWPDGSSVGYGPEGGAGPKELAYLRIAGQGCLYNVWSNLGRDHLASLLDQLRFVETPGG